MDREYRELAERAVGALERLAQDPEIRVETGPPVCPHCETMNPMVKVALDAGQGPLGEYVIKAECQCGRVFYAIPLQWDMAKTVQEVEQVISERRELSGFNGGKDQRTET